MHEEENPSQYALSSQNSFSNQFRKSLVGPFKELSQSENMRVGAFYCLHDEFTSHVRFLELFYDTS